MGRRLCALVAAAMALAPIVAKATHGVTKPDYKDRRNKDMVAQNKDIVSHFTEPFNKHSKSQFIVNGNGFRIDMDSKPLFTQYIYSRDVNTCTSVTMDKEKDYLFFIFDQGCDDCVDAVMGSMFPFYWGLYLKRSPTFEDDFKLFDQVQEGQRGIARFEEHYDIWLFNQPKAVSQKQLLK